MLTPLTIAVAVAAALLGLWCAVAALRDQPVKDWHYAGIAVVTLLTVAQLVVGVVMLAGGDRPDGDSTAVFVSYLVSVTACVPLVGLVALGERSRWGSATVAAGAFLLAILQLRLHDVWGGGVG
ncbi:hypothetical protein [Streptomyces sp. SM14]|uniref:hypothetical protein n=1 Tax=Streptomyces sp. SM14 TaxID=1736045 RepID=UPI000CD5102E|nr:hypothetical protein [Streptomyces sp. SM14]